MLGRAFKMAGFEEKGNIYIESAKKAYAFGTDPNVRVTTQVEVEKEIKDENGEVTGTKTETHTWIEPRYPDASRKIQALIQLILVTDDQSYRDELETEEMQDAYIIEISHMHWRTFAFPLIDIALFPEKFPEGWGTKIGSSIINLADTWLTRQETHPYRKVWYDYDHGYFNFHGWGGNGYRHIRFLIAAWKLTGDQKYKDGAINGVDWMVGANPMGLSLTTGIGQHPIAAMLHLPSFIDGIDEFVPGITIYGLTGFFPFANGTKVQAMIYNERNDHQFKGSAINFLPSPWREIEATYENIRDTVNANVPVWRRLIMMEASNVAQMEFTVWETMSHAVLVTGALMDEGWTPSEALKNRQPKSKAEMKEIMIQMP